MLIVVVHRELPAGPPVNRLYFRAAAGGSYQALPVQGDSESQEDAASCEAAPFLIYSEMRVRPPDPSSSGFAADWIGLRRFDFVRGVSETVLHKQSLCPPSPYVSGWVSSIISAWPDGLGAVCKLGFERPVANGGSLVDYYIYDVAFGDGLGRQVAALPLIFL
jgi:hypothetical protein